MTGTPPFRPLRLCREFDHVQASPGPHRAKGVADQGHLAAGGLRLGDRVVDDLADIAHPHVDSGKAHVARVRTALPVKGIAQKQLALLIEFEVRVVGALAPLGVPQVPSGAKPGRLALAGSSKPSVNVVEWP